MDYVVMAVLFVILAGMCIWHGKNDPVIILAWHCKHCDKVFGKGTVRRAKENDALSEHLALSPDCPGEFVHIEVHRVPIIP